MSKKKRAAVQAVPCQQVHWTLYALLGFLLLLAVGYSLSMSPAEAWANIRRSFEWVRIIKPF